MKNLKLHRTIIYTAVSCAVLLGRGMAQTLPVGTPELEEQYRRLQLLGKLDSTISFSVRPLDNDALLKGNLYYPEGFMGKDKSWSNSGIEGLGIQLLPLQLQTQFTSSYPYGWNDGSMIPAKGVQAMISAGVYARYKWLSIQLRPEMVWAQNSEYRGFNGQTEASWETWYQWANNIDMPERFGNGSYSKVYLGQSSIRANFEPISVGISTENLWWGPGRRNSLLMSNTAPGFLHATVNTTRPIRSGIGSFEGQVVAGRLTGSGYSPTPLGIEGHYDQYYVEKRDDWRYFSGIVFSYQPKWLPGLSLGFTRSFVRYHNESNSSLSDYLPLLGSGSLGRTWIILIGLPMPKKRSSVINMAPFFSAGCCQKARPNFTLNTDVTISLGILGIVSWSLTIREPMLWVLRSSFLSSPLCAETYFSST